MEPDNKSARIAVAMNDNTAAHTTAKNCLQHPRRTNLRFSAALLLAAIIALVGFTRSSGASAQTKSTDPIGNNADRLLSEGRTTFRFETFGDEASPSRSSLP